MTDIDRFLETLASAQTKRAYRTDLERFFRAIDAEIPVGGDPPDIETSDIESFVQGMRNQELSTSTIRRRIAAIRRFFDWRVSKGDLPSNPCRAASLTVKESSASEERTFLTKENLQTLLQVTERSTKSATRDRALILVILYGALRRSELASLDVDDLRPIGRHWVIDLPRKRQSPGGYVKIPDRVADAIQDVIDIYDEDEEDGPLWRSFSNRNWGDRMSPDALYKRVRTLGQEAELGAIDIQTLRRSALRLASDDGASLEEIRRHARLKSEASAAEYVGDESEVAGLNTAALDPLDFNV